MEIFDIVDENGNPTGKTVERKKAHLEGILHRTSHVWIFRIKDGRRQVLLQKRADQKDSYPGCYDISSAGHIPAGDDYVVSALRELQEELGICAKPSQLEECGIRKFEFKTNFHGKPFHDRQVSKVFKMEYDISPDDLKLQKEEVSEVRWFDWEKLPEMLCKNEIPHCIYMEEISILQNSFII